MIKNRSSLSGNKVHWRVLSAIAWFLLLSSLTGCSMGEEMRRIEESKQANKAREASFSTNLTGEQIYVRSCNTCHPGGKEGMGPSLADMDSHFLSDESLKKFIRKGKGLMPSQPLESLNDTELGNLVAYLRKLNTELKDGK